MAKKEYKKPEIKVIEIDCEGLMYNTVSIEPTGDERARGMIFEYEY